jgi:hypothetical protein
MDMRIRVFNRVKAPAKNSVLAEKFSRTVQSTMTIWDLRVSLSIEAAVMPEQIRLSVSSKEVPYTSNAKTLEEVGIVDNQGVSVQTRPPPPKPKVPLIDSTGNMVPKFRNIIESW